MRECQQGAGGEAGHSAILAAAGRKTLPRLREMSARCMEMFRLAPGIYLQVQKIDLRVFGIDSEGLGIYLPALKIYLQRLEIHLPRLEISWCKR